MEKIENTDTWVRFETELEILRREMKIHGMSSAVVKDGKLVWARGLGYADIENHVPSAPEIPYHLASVTKPFAALIIMRLVQEGKLSLDDPASRYGVSLPEGNRVLVRHLLSHTSEGMPGQNYQYNGFRYGLLSQVVQASTRRSLQEWVYERILDPLGMETSAPSPSAACEGLPFAPTCNRVYAAITRLYYLGGDLNPAPGYNGDYFNAGAGLISTVIDLPKYDPALDANTLVTTASKELMWTPTVSNSGQKLLYDLGWFTQSYRGTRLIWNYSYSPPSTSTLILKLPEERLTFIVLANTDMLSRAIPWNEVDVLGLLVALAFYRHYVLAPYYSQQLPAIDWSADSSSVITSIGNVEDEFVRDILSKEFEARKALTSSLADLKATNERLATMRVTAGEVASSLELETLDLYTGEYAFSDMGGFTLNVSRAENKLYVKGPGQPVQELLPLSPTRLFIPVGCDFYQFVFVPNVDSRQTYRLVLTMYGMNLTGQRQ